MGGQPFRALLVSHTDGIGVTRSPSLLARAGCRVTLVTHARNLSSRSRHVSEVVTAAEGASDVVDALASHVASAAPYDIVIVADDPILEALLARADEDWVADCTPVDPRSPLAGAVVFKDELLALAGAEGLPVPRWRRCRSASEAARFAEEVGAPVMVKRPAGSAGAGVRRAEDPAEAASRFRELGSGHVVVEEELPGVPALAACLFDHGELTCIMTCRKERTYLGRYGPSSAMRFVELPGAEAIAATLGRRLGFHGFAGIDFIHDRESGRLTLIELNGRPTPQLHLGSRVGADFADALADVLGGARRPMRRMSPGAVGRLTPLFPEEVVRCLLERDLVGLGRWAWHPAWWRELGWADPRLAYSVVADLARKWSRMRRRARARATPRSAEAS